MCIKNLNNTAFTLLEVLLASVIFVITVAGVFVTLNAVRGPVADRENALAAAVFGKQVFEALYSQVSASVAQPTYYGVCPAPCTEFDLRLGTHQISAGTLNTNGLKWPSTAISNANLDVNGNPVLTYRVTCADGSSFPCTNSNIAHKVVLSVNTP